MMSGRSPWLYCTLNLIAMPGPPNNNNTNQTTTQYKFKKIVIIHDNSAIKPYNNIYIQGLRTRAPGGPPSSVESASRVRGGVCA